MFKKLDDALKRCDEFVTKIAKAAVARDIQEIKQERFERIKKELRLLENIQGQRVSINDAIITRRLILQTFEQELKECNMLA